PGDRITWCVTAGCGSCFFCQHGITQKCQNLRKYGHERFEEIDPYRGGLAESILLWPGTGWMKLPDPIPDEIAATLNCSVATASAALRLAGTLRNQCVVILGAGLLGLMATALAHEAGASSVIVLDPLESARSRAQEFGASHTMPPEQNLATTLVHQLTDQRGADAVLEMSGSSDAVQLGISLLRTGGTMVLAGTVSPVQPVLLDPEHIVRRMLTLRGLHNYQVGDLVTAVQSLERTLDAYPWQKLIGARFSLHEVELAFQWSIKHPGQRAAIYPLWEGLDEG
ncbi:MAG TPA: zinc-binding dehydrogenase, partial [Gemmatales bacterium]|nr:zinc-binding dehydrogenase [Gemmatales bacterium]